MIANRYEPLEVTPPGSAVKARDMQTAQTVMLRPVTRVDDRLRGLFHPAVVAIFDFVQDGKWTYAACEFVQGAITIDTVLLTAKGKSKLDLVHATESNEAADVDQLRGLFAHLRPAGYGGQAAPDLAAVNSAASLAATLRG